MNNDIAAKISGREICDFIRDSIFDKNAFEIISTARTIRVALSSEDLLEVCTALKETRPYYFLRLTDITAVDYPEQTRRFELIYRLYSFKLNRYLELFLRLKENQAVDSIISLWPAADWLERECFDMFGIPFKNHPNLKRILTSGLNSGYPLRKDFLLNNPGPAPGSTGKLRNNKKKDKK
ncbi:MAG: NADH-quinone oxidoreductase subunit C [bacterium]